jgi:N-acetylglucosaminyl-diphospho-decaprenol L-rhamnosyltransferase
MDLTVVLVNYKCDKVKLQSCLNSIKIDTKVLLIDHSHDFTFEGILLPQNLDIKIIKNVNLGNGAGINCGIKNSKTRFVLYLDIDTILPSNFFASISNNIKKIDNFAIVAPKINNIYNEQTLDKTGNLTLLQFLYNKFFYKLKLNNTNFQNIKEQFFVSGAIMLIDKNNTYYKDIIFDENIFMFFEENDFFHQCFKKGEKIYLITDLLAEHLDGDSINDKSLNYECFKKWHWEYSKYYFFNKHYNKILIFLIAFKSMFKFSFKIFLFYFFNKDKYEIYKSRLNGLFSFYLKRKCNIDF